MLIPRPRRLLKKLQEIRKRGNVEVYFQDECHFQRSATIIRGWYLKGSTPEIKSPAVKEKISVMGAMGADNGQLITMETSPFNAVNFRLFLEKVLKRAVTNKKIVLVLDNARFHHAKMNVDFIKSIKRRLELLFLPPYSPDLNPIERFWKLTRRNVTHNRYFESLYEERFDLKRFFNKWRYPNNKLTSLSANY
jgi:transposase